MFDIGFWELAIIGLVALLVIGPERLPRVARTAGLWLGRGRRFLGSVKADIERELKADELKRVLEEQKRNINPLHEIIEDTSKSLQDVKRGTESAIKDAEQGIEAGSTGRSDKSNGGK